jgi:hypothetical protein
MKTETVHKITTIKTQRIIEEKTLDEWQEELAKFTDRDEMVKFNGVIAASAAIEVMKFKNFYEDWEFNSITIKNSAHERLLIDKYLHLHLYDEDAQEVRRIVGLEWQGRRVNGMSAQHVLVTQIVGIQDDVSEETLEPYYITYAIYGMIADAPLPYNAGYQFEEK